MTNENKLAAMDAVGEFPDFGNLLLRESGYPHLDDTPKQSQSDAWNEAGTKPIVPGVYETRVKNAQTSSPLFQLWTGTYWDFPTSTVESARQPFGKSQVQEVEWREVQP